MVILQMASIMEGEWSCYLEGQLNGSSMVILQRWSLMENGHITEVVTLMD